MNDIQTLANIAGMTAECLEKGLLVQVVRCKDCKHYRPGMLIKCAKYHHSKQSRDWYCADGERRTAND